MRHRCHPPCFTPRTVQVLIEWAGTRYPIENVNPCGGQPYPKEVGVATASSKGRTQTPAKRQGAYKGGDGQWRLALGKIKGCDRKLYERLEQVSSQSIKVQILALKTDF